MASLSITLCILLLSALSVAVMLYKFFQQPSEPLSFITYIKLTVTGIISYIADTLGVGSFAVTYALSNFFGTFKDDELYAVNNGAQVIPGIIESLFFMYLIDVDLTTLITLVAGTCVGGIIGGYWVCYLRSQTIRLTMIAAFSSIIILLLAHQFQFLVIGGDLIELRSWMLVIGFFGMMICGALTAFGVGLFVMVQAVLFVMNISPAVAFPIMTIAGAMQEPLTSLILLQKNKIPLKKTLVLSLAGCLGVLIVIPVFSQLTFTFLHLLLLIILMYNVVTTVILYIRHRAAKQTTQHGCQGVIHSA